MPILTEMLQVQDHGIINTVSNEIVARFPRVAQPITRDKLAGLVYPVMIYPNPGGYLGVTGHDMHTDALVVATQTAVDGPEVDKFRSLLMTMLDYQPGDEQPQLAGIPEQVYAVAKPTEPEEGASDEEMAAYEAAMIVYMDKKAEAEAALNTAVSAETATMNISAYSKFVDFLADFNATLLFRVFDDELQLVSGVKRSSGEMLDGLAMVEVAKTYGLKLAMLKGAQAFDSETGLDLFLTAYGAGVEYLIKDSEGNTWTL